MLEVKNLSVNYYVDEGTVKAVAGVSFDLKEGEILGVLGESGSGKSTLGYALLRLVDQPGKIVGGEILLNGRDLLLLPEDELRRLRGAKIAMVFQDPFAALNPVLTIGEQIMESIILHQRATRREARGKAVEALRAVKIDPARIDDYPHQFSGGMRQRVVIAMALACRPEILIADEPTTALDVTIQAEILALLREIKAQFNLSIIYITHNFGIIKELCDRVVVMHKGKIVEAGETRTIFDHPRDAYTKKLVDCLRELR
ncbi:MAG: ABC transporter ATP-binding protein [Candidatus Margulisiibacteriota bacterium]|jgi:ABC-type dipeptide/oligopeptide/nickel transport system ATPase component